LTLVVFSQGYVCADEPEPPTITVTGKAEVRVVPDEGVLTFSIESREKALDAAVKDNDEKIKSVTEFLLASKIEPKHIRTQVISIRPIFEQADKVQWKGQVAQQMPIPNAAPAPRGNDKPDLIKPIGYTARRGLSVTITDLKSFEKIYRGLVERGVNDVGGIQFRTTELRKHRDEARRKAVRAAMEKAAAMAGELGATVAAVQTVTEDTGSRYSNYLSQNVFSSVTPDSESGSSVPAGMIEINASVRIVFRLGDVEFTEPADKKN